ncbi:MAG: hypothetical protein B7X11_06360, partial [Acidobacteria bacterium 37-65-4]
GEDLLLTAERQAPDGGIVVSVNVSDGGVPWAAMTPGARFRAGTVEAEVTGYANPCGNLRAWFAGEDIARVSQKLHPG